MTKKNQMRQSRESDAIIAIVDDDPSVRHGLQRLIRSAGWKTETFASGQEFLARRGAEAPNCLILDLRLPGLSGLDLQKWMAQAGLEIPIVFLTGHGNIPASVQAMKAGAVEFLTKPFEEQALLEAIQEAIELDWRTREQRAEISRWRDRYDSLTAREREVMALLVSGRVNKQIAAEAEISEVTVRLHRGQIMRKMRASSLADLIRIADKIKL